LTLIERCFKEIGMSRYQIIGLLWTLVKHGFLLIVALMCFLPLMLIVSASFTDSNAIAEYGYTLFPSEFSIYAYEFILQDSRSVVQAYGVTIFVTVVGSMGALLVMSLLAYALSRKNLRLRRPLAFYIFFTMLFYGGLVPTYIVISQVLGLRNSLLALILPIMVVPTYVLILRTYFSGIPEELIDAAKIDGAGEWRVFFQIVFPLSTPAFATIGLLCALMYWNDWFLSLLYIDDPNLYSLQYLLYRLLGNIQVLQVNTQAAPVDVPASPARMALAVLAIGPIIFAALFAQKYFVRGITLGALKD
jgi:putative aldouronate transport system permease protein